MTNSGCRHHRQTKGHNRRASSNNAMLSRKYFPLVVLWSEMSPILAVVYESISINRYTLKGKIYQVILKNNIYGVSKESFNFRGEWRMSVGSAAFGYVVAIPTNTYSRKYQFWDSKIVFIEFLHGQRTLNAVYYCGLLGKVKTVYQPKRQRTLLLHDNAKYHITAVIQQTL